MHRLVLIAIACAIACGVTKGDESETRTKSARLDWKQHEPLPDALGVAGPFAGVVDGKLLVAGGANFPDGPPWEGGKKVWHDTIYQLDDPGGKWSVVGKLPSPLGYGVSITFEDRLLCIGGSDATRHYANAVQISRVGGSLAVEPFDPLPIPLANAAGALLNETIYIAGGSEEPGEKQASNRVFIYSFKTPKRSWREIEPIPGDGRILPTAAVQSGAFYLMGGAAIEPHEGKTKRRYLNEAWRYRPASGWKRIADLPRPLVAAPSPAISVGQSHFAVIGGDDGSRVGFEPLDQHPGFNDEVLAYNVVTDTWAVIGKTPAPRVTAPVVPWRGRNYITSGEQRPGVRSPQVWSYTVQRPKADFGRLNYLTLGVYPLIMLGISWAVGRQSSSDGFFRGGGRIPWWAAGLSIYATMLSSITFMAIPATAYTSDWSLTFQNLSITLLAPLVIAVYVPFFRRLHVTSAYEYLERRFNLAVRWFGSASFIILQLGRTAIVLYLPALALATVSDFPLHWCILFMGAISILMTFEGGLESVVWTDVAQTIILLAGAAATLAVAAWQLPGGLSQIWSIAQTDDKLLQRLSWSPSLATETGWAILIGGMFTNLSSYTAGQDVVQRYISTQDERATARSIWTNALLTIPSTLLFFCVGTALYAFYKLNPARMDPTLDNDAVFPLFILNELPAGLGGLVTAGIFAAAQPTSSLNSIATAWVTDFHARLMPSLSDGSRLKIAKAVTIGSGVVGTIAALAMTQLEIVSSWRFFLGLLNLTGSTLAGLFALGIFTRRVRGSAATLAAITSVGLLLYLQMQQLVPPLLIGAVGVTVCFFGGIVLSFLVSEPAKDLRGLTLYTQDKTSS